MTTKPADTNEKPVSAAAPPRNTRLLRWLLQATSLAALRREAAASARTAGIRAALGVAAALLWLLVAGFLLGAFVLWLSGVVGGIASCAIVAAAFAVIALILKLISVRMARRHRHWRLSTQFPGLTEAVRSGAVDDTALGALAVAALAGFFIGLRGKH